MAHIFYNSSRWHTLRKFVLNKQPLCVMCLKNDVTTIATQVDHIIPIKQGGSATLVANLQPLCDTHHSRKTRQENEPEKIINTSLNYANEVVNESVVTKKGKGNKSIRGDR